MEAKLSQARRDEAFYSLANDNRIDRKELIARHVIVLCCSIALWYATEQSVMFVWGAGYVVINSVYIHYLKRCVTPVTKMTYAMALSGTVIVATWFCSMVVYLATLAEGEFIFLAACGCVGLGLHCISRNQAMNVSAVIDLASTLITAIAVALIAAMDVQQSWASITTIIVGICTSVYFIISFRQILSDRQKLNLRAQAETQDQKMRALGQLTSGIAHDFNNLLTVVSGNIELALVDPDENQTRHYLNEAHLAADRGAALVHQLMAYARQSNLNATNIDLKAFFGQLTTVISPLLPSRTRLEISQPRNSLLVSCDADMLESAILNLVKNARDVFGDQDGTIGLSCGTYAEGRAVIICVEDDGPGMDEATLQKATDPFFTTKPVGSGSGLGLSMVKGFAEQSGGSLYLTNRMDGGLMACITLPVAPPPTKAAFVPLQTP